MQTPARDERPREVFLGACDSLAASLAPLGFAYARSLQRLRRKRGPYAEDIVFQSSHHNVADTYVVMWPHVLICRRDHGRCRETHSSLKGDAFAGGQLGNLAGVGWATWNLAGPTARPSVVEAVRAEILTVGLPWIDRVESVPGLIEDALKHNVAGVDIEQLVDYLVFLDMRTDAVQVLQAWLERRSGMDSTGCGPVAVHVYEREAIASCDEYSRGALVSGSLGQISQHARPTKTSSTARRTGDTSRSL